MCDHGKGVKKRLGRILLSNTSSLSFAKRGCSDGWQNVTQEHKHEASKYASWVVLCCSENPTSFSPQLFSPLFYFSTPPPPSPPPPFPLFFFLFFHPFHPLVHFMVLSADSPLGRTLVAARHYEENDPYRAVRREGKTNSTTWNGENGRTMTHMPIARSCSFSVGIG